ncbi:hypothetical protein NCLIV_029400 [Neospora caninum Liverpool]|uniref:Uncharacterized protein n=1 Tax=Neospora caninum (strain Liverpool) TaxID=572307 RepID=F0VHF9_NEOCL|nr:hypothetical protein NCLIV_029400 [Neospora caninum Liverpool]CBZ53153.1 hypothetical protein NCLIV_029400 [Neospora caninum Liverpool]|eukprot:XP_003883185.1 hypothetical protein NCLIV_029400 [Neospora caninum Liverpool]
MRQSAISKQRGRSELSKNANQVKTPQRQPLASAHPAQQLGKKEEKTEGEKKEEKTNDEKKEEKKGAETIDTEREERKKREDGHTCGESNVETRVQAEGLKAAQRGRRRAN